AAALVLRGIWYLFNYFFNIDILSQIPIIHMHCASIQMTYDLRWRRRGNLFSCMRSTGRQINVQNLDYNNR
ncbi:hypothetical protein ACJX0J_038357, partial [Zea mays]